MFLQAEIAPGLRIFRVWGNAPNLRFVEVMAMSAFHKETDFFTKIGAWPTVRRLLVQRRTFKVRLGKVIVAVRQSLKQLLPPADGTLEDVRAGSVREASPLHVMPAVGERSKCGGVAVPNVHCICQWALHKAAHAGCLVRVGACVARGEEESSRISQGNGRAERAGKRGGV